MIDLLTNIADKQKADKGNVHGRFRPSRFTEIYDRYFNDTREKVSNILEIGVGSGNSLRMWREYFPNAMIYGIDNNPAYIFQDDRIVTFLCDQNSRQELVKIVSNLGEFDLILDDGSHNVIHQQISWGCLFSYVKGNGYYVIEDLHTSFGWHGCNWGLPPNHRDNAYNVLKRFKESGFLVLDSPYILDSEKTIFFWCGEFFCHFLAKTQF